MNSNFHLKAVWYSYICSSIHLTNQFNVVFRNSLVSQSLPQAFLGTQTYAFSKLIKTADKSSCASLYFPVICLRVNIASIVDLPVIKPKLFPLLSIARAKQSTLVYSIYCYFYFVFCDVIFIPFNCLLLNFPLEVH